MARDPTPQSGRPPTDACHHAASRRWWPAWRRGLSVGRGRRSQAGGRGRPIAWGPHEAAAAELKARAATHLALQHVEAVERARDRPVGPGPWHARCDRLRGVVEPRGTALHGLLRPGGGARAPGRARRRRPLAPALRQVLGEVDRRGDRGLLGAHLGAVRRLGRRALGRASEHEPRRPAWGKRRARGRRHARPRRPPALASGGQARRLAAAAGRGRHPARAPRVALGWECPDARQRRPAARLPARAARGLGGREATASRRAAVVRHRPWREAQRPLAGGTAAARLGGDGRDGPARAVHGPPLGRERRPAARWAAGGWARGGVAGGGTGPAANDPGCWRTAAWTAARTGCCVVQPCSRAAARCCRSGQRSATGRAVGAPCRAPSAEAWERSRVMTSSPGGARRHGATGAAGRSGRSAPGWGRSRSLRTGPEGGRFRRAKSSTPRTVGVADDGTGSRRSRRRRVFRRTARAQR